MSMDIGRFVDAEGGAAGRLYNLWITFPDGQHSFYPWALFVILLISATLLLLDIFQFRHLVRQFRLCIFNLVLLAGWNIAYIALAWKRTHESGLSFSPEWPAALPIVAIVLICLGMRGIMRDILMLKSLDRLR